MYCIVIVTAAQGPTLLEFPWIHWKGIVTIVRRSTYHPTEDEPDVFFHRLVHSIVERFPRSFPFIKIIGELKASSVDRKNSQTDFRTRPDVVADSAGISIKNKCRREKLWAVVMRGVASGGPRAERGDAGR